MCFSKSDEFSIFIFHVLFHAIIGISTYLLPKNDKKNVIITKKCAYYSFVAIIQYFTNQTKNSPQSMQEADLADSN